MCALYMYLSVHRNAENFLNFTLLSTSHPHLRKLYRLDSFSKLRTFLIIICLQFFPLFLLYSSVLHTLTKFYFYRAQEYFLFVKIVLNYHNPNCRFIVYTYANLSKLVRLEYRCLYNKLISKLYQLVWIINQSTASSSRANPNLFMCNRVTLER